MLLIQHSVGKDRWKGRCWGMLRWNFEMGPMWSKRMWLMVLEIPNSESSLSTLETTCSRNTSSKTRCGCVCHIFLHDFDRVDVLAASYSGMRSRIRFIMFLGKLLILSLAMVVLELIKSCKDQNKRIKLTTSMVYKELEHMQ